MVERGQRVDHRHLGRRGQLGHRLVRAGADHDRVDVAREHPGGVADRLAARELHFVAAQDDRGRAELGDPDLEGDPRPRRGLLEDEGDAAPGQRLGAEPLAAPRFQRGGAVEQLAELEGAQLFACEEVTLQAADTTAVEFTAVSLEPLPRPRLPARPGALHLALATAADRGAQRDPRPGQPRPQPPSSRRCSRRRVGRRAAAGVPAALRRAAGGGLRGRRHRVLTSRNSLGPLRGASSAPQSRPDRLRRGRLEPNPGAGAGPARRDRRAAGAGDPRGRPERRAMAFTRIASGVCVANLHATNDRPDSGDAGRPAGRASGDRVGRRTPRCFSAATSTSAQPRTRASSRAARGFELERTATAPRGDRPPAHPRSRPSSIHRAPGHRRDASCRATAWRCGSPTMPRSGTLQAAEPRRTAGMR